MYDSCSESAALMADRSEDVLFLLNEVTRSPPQPKRRRRGKVGCQEITLDELTE